MMCVEKCDQLNNSRLPKYMRESIGDLDGGVRADMSVRAESQYSICSAPHVATVYTTRRPSDSHLLQG